MDDSAYQRGWIALPRPLPDARGEVEPEIQSRSTQGAGLDAEDGPPDWEIRRFKSDRSTDRVRAFRESQREDDETFQKRYARPLVTFCNVL